MPRETWRWAAELAAAVRSGDRTDRTRFKIAIGPSYERFKAAYLVEERGWTQMLLARMLL